MSGGRKKHQSEYMKVHAGQVTWPAKSVPHIRNVIVVTADPLSYILQMNLRKQVEELLPNWERWYPSLFDAAYDLGLIKAQVCDPNSLLLTNRHARLRQRANDAHREKWGGHVQE